MAKARTATLQSLQSPRALRCYRLIFFLPLLALAAPKARAGDLGILKQTCAACHTTDSKLVGPAWKEIARKYKAQANGVDYLAGKIRGGSSGVWGNVEMPPNSKVNAIEAKKLAQWVLDNG